MAGALAAGRVKEFSRPAASFNKVNAEPQKFNPARTGRTPILTLEDMCKALAPVFKAVGLPAPNSGDVLAQLANENNARMNVLDAKLNGLAGNPYQEQRPLRDERGSAYGHGTGEIPEELLFAYMRPRRLGGLGLTAQEAQVEILKKYPQLRVKARMRTMVSGHRFTRPQAREYAHFAPGVLQLAT